MPFLFEGNHKYNEFMEILQSLRRNSGESYEDGTSNDISENGSAVVQKSGGTKTSGRLLPRKSSKPSSTESS